MQHTTPVKARQSLKTVAQLEVEIHQYLIIIVIVGMLLVVGVADAKINTHVKILCRLYIQAVVPSTPVLNIDCLSRTL